MKIHLDRLLLWSIFPVSLALSIALLPANQPPQTGPATEKRFPPLKVPPGFKATLFACDPLIEYPSVISIGPRPGAIFVAIDYMTGLGTDGKVKSEIRLVEDTDGDGYADKATTVAKGFNSIQGLAYHDGTLFVMHAPFLSAVKDGKRTDLLTGIGLPPEQNQSRLHCANGVVVGHDGWFYLAFGDNGIDIQRPEGDRLIYKGGGILRCRPDGRDLHLFSTGLRNIYDIALDADLNVFTRDNENDGGTYMIRVCHCFHGSDHGYPYDYEERPDHAMKPIGDFGLGSSAGGVCYLETQFPKEYRGNLFFCEWGKSVVRYELKRAGGGFAPVKELEFATGDPKDPYPFKPTDIVVQRDGTLMVSDYADGQRPKRGRGRIYYIRHDSERIKPAPGLDSESYFERCDAQAEFEKTGMAPAWEKLGPRGRKHLIWGLTKRDGAKAIDRLLIIAQTDSDVSVRAQAIRAIGDLADPVLVQHKLNAGRGDAALAKKLVERFHQPIGHARDEIFITLARLRWADAPAWANEHVGPYEGVAFHAQIRMLRRADNWPAVLKLLDFPFNRPMRDVALPALADQFDPVIVDDLIRRLAKEPAPNRQEYIELLARVYKKPGPWKYWGYRPGPRPANTEPWERSEAIAMALDGALADPDREVRLTTLKRMQREKVPLRSITLGRWLVDEYQPERAAAVIMALEQHTDGLRYLEPVVFDKKHSAANRLRALAVLPKGTDYAALAEKLEDGPVLAEVVRLVSKDPRWTGPGGKRLAPVGFFMKRLQSPDAEVRAAALDALGAADAKEAREPVLRLLRDADVRVRRAAAGAVGRIGAADGKDALLKLLTDPDVELRGHCFDALALLRDARAVPTAVAALRTRGLDMKALHYLRTEGGLAQLDAVVAWARENPASEVPVHVVGTLLEWRQRTPLSEAQQEAIERAIAQVHGATGVLTHWRVSEPAPAKMVPRIVDMLGAKGPLNWTEAGALGAESRLHLRAADAAPKDHAWLAACELAVKEGTPVEFLAASRGSLQVWLDGKSIYHRPEPRKFQLDSDRFTATLDKGFHRLLVATSSGNGDVEFQLRLRRKSSKAAHEKLTQAALSRSGNPDRGRKVFFDKDKSLCLKCHQLGNQGERIGPELTGVGARFSRIYLVESILEPSRTIAPSFATLAVSLKNGKVYNGVKVGEDDRTLTVADNQGQKHVLAKADIDEQNPSAVSTMPEGLEARFSEDEFVDLIAFLASQKQGK
jgi:putative membrane-bound dehydrogenase-like protein